MTYVTAILTRPPRDAELCGQKGPKGLYFCTREVGHVVPHVSHLDDLAMAAVWDLPIELTEVTDD